MRKPDNRYKTDVLVIGAGFAGVIAAIHAAQAGADCTIVSTSGTFSGASFFPGTWGFGLIAPDGEADADDLLETILRVGCGMADKPLAQTLVGGIHAGVRELEDCGLKLLRPVDKAQQAFIPCFDHKNRDWYGLVQQEAKTALGRRLDELGVRRLVHTEILSLTRRDGRVCGALGARADGFLEIACKSVVIACGGLAGVYRYAFGSSDCCGLGQLLALEAGAHLVNLEFHQMMPGFVQPAPRTVYNEKVFRCSAFYDAQTGAELFADLSPAARAELLECRSGHGPFTSRLPSRAVDLRIFSRFLAQKDGVVLRYDPAVMENPPEFVRTYFDWLLREKNLTPQDEVRLGIFYHAANGGIAIDPAGFTGVEGLYACGEATGGMHGADRLGGLSTANALVFGARAGENAAACAAEAHHFQDTEPPALRLYEEPRRRLNWLKGENFAAQMLGREESALQKALERAQSLCDLPQEKFCDFTPAESAPAIASRTMEAAAWLSQAMLQAALLRRESRGSHYRLDYPQSDPACAKRILIFKETDGAISAQWEPTSDEVRA